ncbi:MAG: exodeoxyribonuclease VII small subunit [Clostridiales Family XIII bacterium]|jgi:exodeoxyribonuclease VII small subunit|nr:exodeoxyribonuclease VII small subunit [Clostridiales Family XIII bacterium]
MSDKELSFEEALGQLESCAERISSPDVTLEDAIKAYEAGASYYAQCDQILENAKQRIAEIGPGKSTPGEEG